MPTTIDSLEVMRRLCDDPLLMPEEAEQGIVLAEEEEGDGTGERCGGAASGVQSGSGDISGVGDGVPG